MNIVNVMVLWLKAKLLLTDVQMIMPYCILHTDIMMALIRPVRLFSRLCTKVGK